MLLREGTTAEMAISLMSNFAEEFLDVATAKSRDAYLATAAELEDTLSMFFETGSVLELIHTQRHHYILTSSTYGELPNAPELPSLNAAVSQECMVLAERLSELRGQFEKLGAFLAPPGLLLLLDTNILMHCVRVDTIAWHAVLGVKHEQVPRLIVPLAVVDELDRKKFEGSDEMRERARKAIGTLHDLLGTAHPDEPAVFACAGGASVDLEIPRDDVGRHRKTATDDELIDFGAFLKRAAGDDRDPAPAHPSSRSHTDQHRPWRGDRRESPR